LLASKEKLLERKKELLERKEELLEGKEEWDLPADKVNKEKLSQLDQTTARQKGRSGVPDHKVNIIQASLQERHQRLA